MFCSPNYGHFISSGTRIQFFFSLLLLSSFDAHIVDLLFSLVFISLVSFGLIFFVAKRMHYASQIKRNDYIRMAVVSSQENGLHDNHVKCEYFL